RVSGDTDGWWCEVPAATSQKSQSERPRGTLDTFDQTGIPVEADPVRGEVVAARSVELSGTLSPGTKPPRQGQSVAVLSRGGKFAGRDPFSRAARWLTQVLQPRRMSIFTIRAVRSISELRGDTKQLGNESGLRDCILFRHPSHSALANHMHCFNSLQGPPSG